MNNDNKITVTPDGSFLYSISQAYQKWSVMLSEWIDNAFDAEAACVSIEYRRNGLVIKDDGRGCKSLIDMVKFGAHTKHNSTKLGRYGIGAKEAALWAGGINSMVTIDTKHAGRHMHLSLNWKEYSTEWELNAPEDLGACTDTGTTIQIMPLERNVPDLPAWKELMNELGYQYSPALKHGRQIKFKRPTKNAQWELLQRWELPAPQGEIIDTHIQVNGRDARVYCSVVKDGIPNPRNGFTYLHEWRVIEKASSHGCGDIPATRVCGFVQLDPSWLLTKNKQSIDDKLTPALYAEVERVSRPVLERARRIGMEIRSRWFDNGVSATLSALVSSQKAKAKRGKGTGHGTKTATNKGGRHTRAAREQDGDRFLSRTSGKWTLDFYSLGVDGGLGQVKPPSLLILNLDNPMVKRMRDQQNADAVTIMAVSLLTAEQCYEEKPPLFKDLTVGNSTEDFSKVIGAILAADLKSTPVEQETSSASGAEQAS